MNKKITLIRCPKCGNAYYIDKKAMGKERACAYCNKMIIPLQAKPSKMFNNIQENWEEELSVLAEKYCQHNDTDEFNNCLYWIFRPVIVKALKAKDKEFIEILNGVKVKIIEDWSVKASAENMEAFKKLNNKIKQIKQKYE